MQDPGAVLACAAIAACEYAPAGGLALAQPATPSACCSFSMSRPLLTDVVSVAEIGDTYVAVMVVTFAGCAGVAVAGAVARTNTARDSPTFNVTAVVPQTTGVSVPISSVPLAFASTKACEVQPNAARESARQPAAKLAVSMALPLLVSVWV